MNSKRKCKYCGEYSRVDRGFITPDNSFFCIPNHAVFWAKEKIDKQREKKIANLKKREKKEIAKQRRDFYAKDIRHQLGLCQTVFNKLRRLQEFKWFADRGLEPTCISCDKPNMDWCCGHLKTVGSQGALRFDELNTALQCNRYCNKGLSGNINGNKTTRGYLQGLRDRYGEERAREIIEYCEVDRIAEWNCEELIAMRKQWNVEIRELEKIL